MRMQNTLSDCIDLHRSQSTCCISCIRRTKGEVARIYLVKICELATVLPETETSDMVTGPVWCRIYIAVSIASFIV